MGGRIIPAFARNRLEGERPELAVQLPGFGRCDASGVAVGALFGLRHTGPPLHAHPAGAEARCPMTSRKGVTPALTPATKSAIERAERTPLATAAAAGMPNVLPVKYVEATADDLVWFTDNHLRKTLANRRDNPQAAFYVWFGGPKLCGQVKGTVEIHAEGADHERMKARLRPLKPDLPARALVVFRIREICECLAGADPGHRLRPPA